MIKIRPTIKYLSALVLAFALISCSSPTADTNVNEPPKYTVNISTTGMEGDNSISLKPGEGKHGDTVIIDYTVDNALKYNLLDFSGVAEPIDSVLVAMGENGKGSRSYTINKTDAQKGIITIFADFSHTNLELDPIEFEEMGAKIIAFDEAPYSNPIVPGYMGSGKITYSSSNEEVAAVDNSGLVTVYKIGSAVITALKEADEEWAEAKASYYLVVTRAELEPPSPPALASRTDSSATLIPPSDADSRFAIEYSHNTSGLAPAAEEDWQDDLFFDGLDEEEDYFFYARYKADPEKNYASEASTGLLLPAYNEGDGTISSPFRVVNAETLKRVGKGIGEYAAWSLSAHYKQAKDIDMAGEEFAPIGDNNTENNNSRFSGSYDGNGKTISNLTINAPNSDVQGLFGYIGDGAIVRNLGLLNISIAGKDYVGGVVGINYHGTVENCYISGSVIGRGGVGGIVGSNFGTVRGCHSTGSVYGDHDSAGGVVGINQNLKQMLYPNSGMVEDCYSTGSVSGAYIIGGVVGYNSSGTVQNCYATGSVIGGNNTGGVAGYNAGGTVRDSYATGSVSGGDNTGGVVGWNYAKAAVQNCYATGDVLGGNNVGGVVGESSGTVQNCYATGNVTGRNTVGGVVGRNYSGTVQNCYAIGDVSGYGGDIGGAVGSNRENVLNLVALNKSTTKTSPLGTIGRAIGFIGHSNFSVSNIHARSDMYVWYAAKEDGVIDTEKTLDEGADKADGADVIADDYNGKNSGTWWKNTAGFSEEYWIFEENKLPILKNVGGVQNPTVQ